MTDPDDIPDWVQRGCFAIVQWTTNRWHAVYIGAGTGSYTQYWAHSEDARMRLAINLFGLNTDHVEFYGPDTVSPETISIEDRRKQ